MSMLLSVVLLPADHTAHYDRYWNDNARVWGSQLPAL